MAHAIYPTCFNKKSEITVFQFHCIFYTLHSFLMNTQMWLIKLLKFDTAILSHCFRTQHAAKITPLYNSLYMKFNRFKTGNVKEVVRYFTSNLVNQNSIWNGDFELPHYSITYCCSSDISSERNNSRSHSNKNCV